MTYLWSGMILIGIVYGVISGNMQDVTEAVVSCSREAVSLCVSMAGITAFWTGLMKIAEMAGLVEGLAAKLEPVLHFFFPRLKRDSKAYKFISINFLSNFLGLNWAATPAGLEGMKELAKEEEKRRKADTILNDKNVTVSAVPEGMASDEMCTFLIMNISSLQLIPVNIIAYRAQYGSVDSAAIMGPAIFATAVSTVTAAIFCKLIVKVPVKKSAARHDPAKYVAENGGADCEYPPD